LEIFNFFLTCYRKDILTFSGTQVRVDHDPNGEDGKMTFRKFDNGDYKLKQITTRHPNVVFGVIKGKKSWGLWLNMYTDGIVDWSFTIEEIQSIFSDHDIKIPDPLWKDFLNVLERKKRIRNEKYFM
tara:strand:- start:1751 stop:2131 length:381 start_codon:yes stop_codon:yes gene_type:complete